MLASKLMEKLNDLISEYGDKEIYSTSEGYFYKIVEVEGGEMSEGTEGVSTVFVIY